MVGRKKHEFVKEMHGSRYDARQFLQKIKRISEGFKTGSSFCKDHDGNRMTDIKSSLDQWRTHFNAIHNGDDTYNTANEMIRPSWPKLWIILPQLHPQTGKKWPLPISG